MPDGAERACEEKAVEKCEGGNGDSKGMGGYVRRKRFEGTKECFTMADAVLSVISFVLGSARLRLGSMGFSIVPEPREKGSREAEEIQRDFRDVTSLLPRSLLSFSSPYGRHSPRCGRRVI